MNKDNAKEYLPIIQAWIDGKTIQFRSLSGWSDVLERESLEFSRPPTEYRIKPEPPKPREWIVAIPLTASTAYAIGKPIIVTNTDWKNDGAYEAIRVREILESNQ